MWRFYSLAHFTRYRNNLIRSITSDLKEHAESDSFSRRMRRHPAKPSIIKENATSYPGGYTAYKSIYSGQGEENNRVSRFNP